MANTDLGVGEILVGVDHGDSPDELLWRQITPHLWLTDDGIPASHAFGPSSADNGKPSYSRESKVTAQEAFEWHNSKARSPSVGTWACSLQEVNEADAGVIDDSRALVDPPSAPGHCYVDFRGLSRGEKKELRSILLRFALRRGLVHPDEPAVPAG